MKLEIEAGDGTTNNLLKDIGLVAALMGSACRIGVDGAMHVAHIALQSQSIDGVPVEFGCYMGQSAAMISMLTGKEIWLYDSFEGLPEFLEQDGCSDEFCSGIFKYEPEKVVERFRNFGLPRPKIFKGWFNDLKPEHLPDKISFAHLDGDLYDSIFKSLELVYPRLSGNAPCVIHDYVNPDLPGAALAVSDFMKDKPEKVRHLVGFGGKPACHGWFQKL